MRLINKMKAGAKNVASKTNEEVETLKLRTDISSRKSDIEKAYTKLGSLYYENYGDEDEDFKTEAKAIVDEIKCNLEQIAILKRKIEETETAGKQEREANWAASSSDEYDKEDVSDE